MIEFPDVSNHNPGLNLAGVPAVIAKASEGSWFTDPFYPGFRAQAEQLGIPFAAYHWVDTDDLAAQAAHAYAVIGPATPVMWDAEAPGSTVDRLLELTDRYRALGGRATLVYLPRWWWRDHLGQPDLTPLAAAGLGLVSSDYDTVPPDGWYPYGGVTPSIWQYTSTQHFDGQLVDFNRYPGTSEQLDALFHGGTDMTPEEHDMLTADHTALFVGTDGLPTIPGQRGQGQTSALVDYLAYIADQNRHILAALTAATPSPTPPPAGPVDLTPGAVAQVAQAVADEEAHRMAQ